MTLWEGMLSQMDVIMIWAWMPGQDVDTYRRCHGMGNHGPEHGWRMDACYSWEWMPWQVDAMIVRVWMLLEKCTIPDYPRLSVDAVKNGYHARKMAWPDSIAESRVLRLNL